MTLATLGPPGTFSHELAVRLYGDDCILLPTIGRIIEAVACGEADGLVPLENSEAGGVGPTLQGLRDGAVFITEEAYMPIRHHFAARCEPSEIATVYAHPQTHEQCSEFLDRLGIDVVHTSSNAASAVAMLEHDDAGAVISLSAAEIYHLPIVRRDVQNSSRNVTRFVRIASSPRDDAGCTKCSILVDPAINRAGLLHDLLGVFAGRSVNLTRIESRPSRRGIGTYVFFIDFEVTPGCGDVLRELHAMTAVKELGCYTCREVPEWR
jgi:prephenate dehydratase